MPDEVGSLTLWWLASDYTIAGPRRDGRNPGQVQGGHLVARGPRGVTYSVPAVFCGWRARVKWPKGESPTCTPLPTAIAVVLAKVLGLPGAKQPTADDWKAYGVWAIDQRRELDKLDEEGRRDPLRFMGSEDYHRMREEVLAR